MVNQVRVFEPFCFLCVSVCLVCACVRLRKSCVRVCQKFSFSFSFFGVPCEKRTDDDFDV